MEQNEKVSLVTRRYLWKNADSDKICVKVITGVQSEHDNFSESLLADESIIVATSEYLSEYDLLQFGVVVPIKKMEVN